MFKDHYKNIGYYINTNDYQLDWYLIISFGKMCFVLMTIYHLLPRFGFSYPLFVRIITWLLVLLSLEYLVAKSYFLYLDSRTTGNFRIDWDYDFLSVLGTYILLGFASITLVASKNWLEAYQNLKSLYRTEQAYLQIQKKLNPHFIFNTLNNMYEIAVTSQEEKIQNSLLYLTDVLRYTIESSGTEEVSLSTEVSAIKSYIELQKEKLDLKEVTLDVSIDINNPILRISPLILLNYIENAFEHGQKNGKPSNISIALKEKHGDIHLNIKNTNLALKKNVSGGNAKTQKILEMKYPGKHKIKIDSSENYYNLYLWIQGA